MRGSMRAVRKLGAGRGGAVVDVPIPPVGSNEVLVRVEAASICGTDLHIWNWDDWSSARVRPPITLGHEMAGTVVEVGAGMERTAVGDFVSAESHVTCGVCFQCRTGQAHMCPQTSILGVDRDGCFAEYVVIPEKVLWHTDRSRLPPEIATLQEPFGNAVFSALAHRLTGHPPGRLTSLTSLPLLTSPTSLTSLCFGRRRGWRTSQSPRPISLRAAPRRRWDRDALDGCGGD